MKTVVINYNAADSWGGTPAAVPTHITGKFLQIAHNNTEYLIFSPKEITAYHADILERFCRERDIKGSYDMERKCYEVDDPSLTVEGGGKFEIDTVVRSIRIYDDSMAYGKFNPSGLREKVLALKELAGYNVTIE